MHVSFYLWSWNIAPQMKSYDVLCVCFFLAFSACSHSFLPCCRQCHFNVLLFAWKIRRQTVFCWCLHSECVWGMFDSFFKRKIIWKIKKKYARRGAVAFCHCFVFVSRGLHISTHCASSNGYWFEAFIQRFCK